MIYLMHVSAVMPVAAAPPPGLPKLLGQLADGSTLGSLAFSEAGSRSHFWAPVSKATTDGDMVRLKTGTRRVTSAGHADIYVASTGSLGVEGVDLYAVPSPSLPRIRSGLGPRRTVATPSRPRRHRRPMVPLRMMTFVAAGTIRGQARRTGATEVVVLARAIDRAAAGAGTCLLISGEEGSGNQAGDRRARGGPRPRACRVGGAGRARRRGFAAAAGRGGPCSAGRATGPDRRSLSCARTWPRSAGWFRTGPIVTWRRPWWCSPRSCCGCGGGRPTTQAGGVLGSSPNADTRAVADVSASVITMSRGNARSRTQSENTRTRFSAPGSLAR